MAKQNVPLYSFNRGLVSRYALARTDLERLALSAEEQHNYISDSLGPMRFRPGLEYLIGTYQNGLATYIPFVYAIDDVAKIEFTQDKIRILVDDVPFNFSAVTTTITNGEFTTDLTGWTDADDAGTTSVWSSESGGSMKLTGSHFNYARRRQQVAVTDVGVRHGIVVKVARGEINFRIGNTAGADDVVEERLLEAGTHIVAFDAPNPFHIEIAHVGEYSSIVESCTLHPTGDIALDSPYSEADFPNIRYDQSGNFIYLGCRGYKQRILRRFDTMGSWSLQEYLPKDGPFRLINATSTNISSSAIDGDVTLTASKGIFRSGHEGALFRLDSIGQTVELDINGQNQFTNAVRVIGVGTVNRKITMTISGTFTATVTLQRSIGDTGNWQDVPGVSFVAPASSTYNDGLDNQIVYYRLGVKSGDYTSGTVSVSIEYPSGTITGIARIIAVASPTSATAMVLEALGSTDATENWYESRWSDYRGYASVPLLHEGRLWWAGNDRIEGCVSDQYETFDDTVTGDSGPISRSIGSGPVDNIFWMKSVQRILMGVASRILNASSSSLEEPLTPTNFNLKPASTQGASRLDAVTIDYDCVFVQRSLKRVYELSIDQYTLKYSPVDLSVLVPEIGEPFITKIAVQRQPDTRIHMVRSDGTVAILTHNKVETVRCWQTVGMDAAEDLILDVLIMPGDGEEDEVNYLVKSGSNYYLTRWAQQDECVGGQLNKQADLFVSHSGSPISTLTGTGHLDGRDDIVVWADGEPRTGPFESVAGEIDLGGTYSNVVAGAYYSARWKSTKLAYAAQAGTALTQKKNLGLLGLILADTHINGLKYGRNFDSMDPIPRVLEGEVMPENHVFAAYDAPAFPLRGEWNTDARLCLFSEAPMPCTVMAAIVGVDTSEKM